ncbi:MAG: selenide, water dikinase SelD [Planctomycetes bacterium]|nr:selenide, water dikinase SelD [Planctomycetota bacterium]
MSRSMRLGHCVCDPRKGCPCDLLREHDVCTCAGERLADGCPSLAMGAAPTAGERPPVRLSQHVRHAGCASKINAEDLRRVLAGLPEVRDPRLLVGAATADDAGVFRLTDSVALVQTVDVFTPCVDDPYLFGQIAAANSVSDVYAMGGRPVTALSIIGFPIETLPHEVMQAILRGGLDKLAEAGVVTVGGHSINDEEVKFGFAVTGVVEPEKVVTNAGARPGDLLVLTKPLGTGIVALAAQLDRASPAALDAAARAMSALNRVPAELMVELGAHACTDVTGFGLVGHLCHVVRESGVTAEVWWDALPLLPDAWDYARAGMLSGAAERNRSFAEAMLSAEGAPEEAMAAACDAQTSGGLLVALPAHAAGEYVERLHAAGVSDAAIVGAILEKSNGRIILKKKEHHTMPPTEPAGTPGAAPAKPCCAGGATAATANAAAAHDEFLGAAFAPGAIDAVTKELITIGLAVLARCGPCVKYHVPHALKMGITRQEIEEVAWMAVAMGGAPVMMFWNETARRNWPE